MGSAILWIVILASAPQPKRPSPHTVGVQELKQQWAACKHRSTEPLCRPKPSGMRLLGERQARALNFDPHFRSDAWDRVFGRQ